MIDEVPTKMTFSLPLAALASLIASITFAGVATTCAKSIPPEVQASIDDYLASCDEKHRFEKGFLTRKDINGDGREDFILGDGREDFILDAGSFVCGQSSTLYCGSAGCVTTVFASLPDGKYLKVLDENVQEVTFKSLKGRPAMILGLHGSACGKTGAEACEKTLRWNGSAFSPAD